MLLEGWGLSSLSLPKGASPLDDPMIALGCGLRGLCRHTRTFCPTATTRIHLLMGLQRVLKLPITSRGYSKVPAPAANALPEDRAGP